MPDLDLPQRQAPDSLMLTGFWYRALPADRVHRNHYIKRRCSKSPSSSAATASDIPSPCATPARIAACRSTAAASTEKISSADITAGSSMSTMASAN